jgi:ubiquitin carboxyl-terminal hydrolase L3
MKQYARNACGTIALFHMILNAREARPEIVTAGSFLDNFYTNSNNVDSKQRGELFKNNQDILNEHKQAVQEGQSGVSSECDSHFIAFIPKNGRLYELDGFKKGPVDHGECSQE